jgi:excisionase family DNA binding protein
MKADLKEVERKKGTEMNVESTAEDDRLWTVHEAARFLNLSPGTVYHLISERRLPCIHISCRCVRLSKRALLKWLQELSAVADPSDRARKR